MMENTTFKNKELINELNTNFTSFYSMPKVKDITFNKHTSYFNRPNIESMN
jgi:hypothetical protein